MNGVADRYAFEHLWRHYRQCRRNKRNTRNALAFEIDAEANLLELQRELRAHTYRPGRSICFITDGPKPREVFAADFRDRVVHHLLVHHLERVFEPRFIHDSYGAICPLPVIPTSGFSLPQSETAILTANGMKNGQTP